MKCPHCCIPLSYLSSLLTASCSCSKVCAMIPLLKIHHLGCASWEKTWPLAEKEVYFGILSHAQMLRIVTVCWKGSSS